MDNMKDRKGIRISTFNYVTVIVACLLYAVLIYETINISLKYRTLIQTTQEYISCEQDASLLSTASDYLTEQVRLCVINKDPKYLTAYFDELQTDMRREAALEDLQEYHSEDTVYESLQKALECSDELAAREMYAMKLVAEACDFDQEELPQEILDIELTQEDQSRSKASMLNKARDMVFNEEYQEAKAEIQTYVSMAVDPVLDDTLNKQNASVEELQKAIVEERFCLSVLMLADIITFIMITLFVVRPLHTCIWCIKNQQKLSEEGTREFRYLAYTYNEIYTKNKAYEAILKKRAESDGLTGIMNRGAFEHITTLLLNEPVPIAMALIDVDQFKRINDTYGHDAGDQVLKKTAHIMEHVFRSSDYIARFGGDEFAVIMINVTEEQKPVIEKKINKMNQVLSTSQDDTPTVSLSVGVAFSDHGYSEELFKHADQALYQVKESGRCGYAFWEE